MDKRIHDTLYDLVDRVDMHIDDNNGKCLEIYEFLKETIKKIDEIKEEEFEDNPLTFLKEMERDEYTSRRVQNMFGYRDGQ